METPWQAAGKAETKSRRHIPGCEDGGRREPESRFTAKENRTKTTFQTSLADMRMS